MFVLQRHDGSAEFSDNVRSTETNQKLAANTIKSSPEQGHRGAPRLISWQISITKHSLVFTSIPEHKGGDPTSGSFESEGNQYDRNWTSLQTQSWLLGRRHSSTVTLSTARPAWCTQLFSTDLEMTVRMNQCRKRKSTSLGAERCQTYISNHKRRSEWLTNLPILHYAVSYYKERITPTRWQAVVYSRLHRLRDGGGGGGRILEILEGVR